MPKRNHSRSSRRKHLDPPCLGQGAERKAEHQREDTHQAYPQSHALDGIQCDDGCDGYDGREHGPNEPVGPRVRPLVPLVDAPAHDGKAAAQAAFNVFLSDEFLYEVFQSCEQYSVD